jgi:hypothetical protein
LQVIGAQVADPVVADLPQVAAGRARDVAGGRTPSNAGAVRAQKRLLRLRHALPMVLSARCFSLSVRPKFGA